MTHIQNAASDSARRRRSALPRREFLAGATAGMAAGLMVHSSLAAAEQPRLVRIGLVGCGGRGSGAINDSLTINDNVSSWRPPTSTRRSASALRKTMRGGPRRQGGDPRLREHGGLDGYKTGARRSERRPRAPRLLPRLPADPRAGGGGGGQARVRREAGLRRSRRLPHLPRGPRGGRGQGAERRRAARSIAGRSNYVGAVEQIRAGRDRRHHRGHGPLLHRAHLVPARKPRDERRRVPAEQLDALHLAQRRPDRRAGGAQPRHDQLGDGRATPSPPSARAAGSPGPTTARCGTAFSSTTSIRATGSCRSCAGRSPARQRRGQRDPRLEGHLPHRRRQRRLADPRPLRQRGLGDGGQHRRRLQAGAQGSRRFDPRRQADRRTAADGRQLAGGGAGPRGGLHRARRSRGTFVAKESKLDLFPKDLTWESSLPKPQYAVPGKTKLV